MAGPVGGVRRRLAHQLHRIPRLHIPAGHIHTPDMQHFETSFNPSDGTFDAWRLAIVGQAQNLIHVVADNAG
jgi:hypothetical protein